MNIDTDKLATICDQAERLSDFYGEVAARKRFHETFTPAVCRELVQTVARLNRLAGEHDKCATCGMHRIETWRQGEEKARRAA